MIPSSPLLFVRYKFQEIAYLAIENRTDSVDLFNFDSFGFFIIHLGYGGGTYPGVFGKHILIHFVFSHEFR